MLHYLRDDTRHARLLRTFDYNPISGELTKIHTSGKRNSKWSISGHGYKQVRHEGQVHLVHRIIWEYVHGEKPPCCIDHIDHDKTNNKLSNLRLATHSENARNQSRHITNSSGFTGVCFYKERDKWSSRIKVNGVTIHLGLFTNKIDAINARQQAEIKYNFHPNHGRL